MKKIINNYSDPMVFFPDGYTPTSRQMAMADNLLHNILFPLLPLAGGSFILNSGARTPADIERLEREGYHPSKNSDHLFGIPEPTVGACDVVPASGVDTVWDWIVAHVDRHLGNITLPDGKYISVGQAIREQHHTAWLHLSNPRKMFFPDAEGKKTLLRSDDNGKTYQEV